MKHITLKKLTLSNFKGVKSFEVDFNETLTTIMADNGKGKTTILDAFLWLFFGKNSAWQSNFEVRPKDENGEVIHHLDSSITAVFDTFSCARVLSEKWTNKRGSLEQELTGTETAYYFNEIPLKEKDFKVKIQEIISEDLFMLITNPYYFNGTLKPEIRREMLIKLVGGEVPDSVIATGNESFIELLSKLTGKTLKEYMMQINESKKRLKEDIEKLPIRIDEVTKTIPEELPNIDEATRIINEKRLEIVSIDEQISSESKQNEELLKGITAKQQEIYTYKNAILKIEHEIKSKASEGKNEAQQKINSIKTQLSTVDNNIFLKERELKSKTETLNQVTKDKTELLEKYYTREAEKFDDSEWVKKIADEESKSPDFSGVLNACPTCKRDFDAEFIGQNKIAIESAFIEQKAVIVKGLREQLRVSSESFNLLKAKDLSAWLEKGKSMKVDADALTQYIEKVALEIAELKKEQAIYQEQIKAEESKQTAPVNVLELIEASPEIKELKTKIETIESLIEATKVAPAENTELKTKKAEANAIIEAQQKVIYSHEQIEAAKKRITELKQQHKELGIKLSLLEKEEFTAYQFNKAKMSAIEGSINSKFKYVRFKMFKALMNGGEEPACICEVNSNGSWVDYSSNANYAAKLNAGIDIINAFSEFSGISFPIFVDNKESVSELLPTLSQVICLEKVYGINNLTVK